MNDTDPRWAARQHFQARYRTLYGEVLEVLFQVDPLGVHGPDNPEKLVPEAASVLARLRDARSAEDVEQIVQEELRRWYGRRRLVHQDPDRLTRATIAICSAWNRFLATSGS
ncbi:MAG TPA: hypothetical protein VG370_27085 [Chloroflexota bacterium]|jgi:hypothetical protein|nr:hypothetical protein [Chloroflexota bacterium]